MTAVFLSAGVPSDQSFPTVVDQLLVRECVLALVSVVTTRHTLVFGGHPAISPLVLHAARSLGTESKVEIWQSEFFRSQLIPEALAFKNIRWTASAGDLAGSLLIMRTEMIRSANFAAAVFVGGMDGLLEEHRMFVLKHPSAVVLPVASTGGAAKVIFDSNKQILTADLRVRVESSIRYRELFRRAIP